MSEWISVDERLPNPDDLYIAFHKDWTPEVHRWHSQFQKTVIVGLLDNEMTHWMPIPELPDADK